MQNYQIIKKKKITSHLRATHEHKVCKKQYIKVMLLKKENILLKFIKIHNLYFGTLGKENSDILIQIFSVKRL